MVIRADSKRFGRHGRHIGCAALILPALLLAVEKAQALNWEGHDDWFLDNAPFHEFFEGVPPPKVKPLPDCDARQSAYEENRYEQIPLPGVNCRKVSPKTGS